MFSRLLAERLTLSPEPRARERRRLAYLSELPSCTTTTDHRKIGSHAGSMRASDVCQRVLGYTRLSCYITEGWSQLRKQGVHACSNLGPMHGTACPVEKKSVGLSCNSNDAEHFNCIQDSTASSSEHPNPQCPQPATPGSESPGPNLTPACRARRSCSFLENKG